MSTSNTHQQSLADAGSETRPPMLERAMRQRVERLMRGTMQNKVDRETRFNNEFDQFVAESGEALVSVYNRFAQLMNDLERNGIKFPKVIVNTKFLNCLQLEWLKTTSPYYVTHPSLVVDYDDDYQGDAVQNTSKDPLTYAMILLARAITQHFSNPINNRLRTSSNTRNQAIVQADKVLIQSTNSGNDGRSTRCSYVQEEVNEGTNIQNDAGNIQRNLRTTSSGTAANVQCYNCSEKEGVIVSDEQNDFLFADATRMEDIEELSANICLMTRIQPANFDSDVGLSYDYAFLSEVQTPSTSYVNPLFAKDKQDQKYPKQPKIINNTIGDDQIDSNIIFDEPNEDVNSGSVEYDNNVQESYELEQLARNAYREAEKQQIIAKKVQLQNTVLTKQLESY
ncbi:hypothetical protein Tco_1389909 [Tanacetum coccineum]